MTHPRRCWCGSGRLARFDNHYLGCRDCETLIVAEPPASDPARVADESDFYGRRYWFEHQRELGQPDLEHRATADLGERCLHWLRTVLAYRPPPGRVLELGCAHGGFVRLLRDAGYDATGLELSPWVVDYARRTFDVPVLCGPLEDHDLEPESFDVVAAMDVLEHFAEPAATMARAVELLKDDGLLVIQTPRRPAGRSYEDLAAESHRFLEMLLPEEHLQLFSERGLRQLLEGAGAGEIAFEPALFSDYDMFAIAGRRPLERRSDDAVREGLSRDGGGRRILAMLDLRELADRQARAFAQADADRTARQRQVDELHGLLAERDDARRQLEALLRQEIRRLEEDRRQAGAALAELQEEHARTLERIDELQREHERRLGASEADRERQRQELETVRGELGRQQETISRLEIELDHREESLSELKVEHARQQAALQSLEAERDRLFRQAQRVQQERAAAREAAARLEAQLGDLRQTLVDVRSALANERRAAARLRAELETTEAARQELGQKLDELGELQRRAVHTLEVQDAAKGAADEALEILEARVERLEAKERALREVVEEHRTSRIYRALVAIGRWRFFDRKAARALELPPAQAGDPAELAWRLGAAARKGPADAAPTVAVDLTALLPGGENGGAKPLAIALVRALRRLESGWRFLLLTTEPCHAELAGLEGGNVRRIRVPPEAGALGPILRETPVDLLFCPMTAPPFLDPRVPLVSLVLDLQYLTYPEFFSSAERAARERDFRRAVESSERVVTLSEYGRRSVLAHGGLPPERVVAVPYAPVQGSPAPAGDDRIDRVLRRYGLEREGFLLYPANFWPHKNHPMLLTAFGVFRRRCPESRWRLVLTGADKPDPAPVRQAARRMGLGEAVVFPGYVPADELDVLLESCAALIFPSLYEGLGMPVIEAMAHGRPVLASDVTALPEVAGDAALLFDPRKPEDIAGAIERVAREPRLRRELREMGRRRAAEIGDPEQMAAGYLDVLREVLAAPHRVEDGLHGVYADGWTAPVFVVGFAPSDVPRTLELEALAPPGAGAHPPVLSASSSGGESFRARVPIGRPLAVRCELPAAGGWLSVDVEPAFVPAARGITADVRELGVKLRTCRLAGGGGTADDLLERSGADG